MIVIVSASSLVLAGDDAPSKLSSRIEHALDAQLRTALTNQLIDQNQVNSIQVAMLASNTDTEQLQLYYRVCEVLRSRQEQVCLERAFFNTLDQAMNLDLIDAVQYRRTTDAWYSGSTHERQILFDRMDNLIASNLQDASVR